MGGARSSPHGLHVPAAMLRCVRSNHFSTKSWQTALGRTRLNAVVSMHPAHARVFTRSSSETELERNRNHHALSRGRKRTRDHCQRCHFVPVLFLGNSEFTGSLH